MHFIISLDYHVEEISLATTKSCVLVTMFDHLTCVIAFVELMQKSEKDKSIYFKSRHKKIHLKKKIRWHLGRGLFFSTQEFPVGPSGLDGPFSPCLDINLCISHLSRAP